MIDPGSTLSFLTNKVATAFKAKHIPFATSIKGLAEVTDLTKPDSQTFYNAWCRERSYRLRIVFGASACTISGYSLNDTLIPGPTL